MADELQVTGRVRIPLSDILVRASRSGGPGGQHANVTASRIEVVFDVRAATTLSAAQRERVMSRLGPVVTAVSQDSRSQARNRELALERLAGKLAAALAVQRPRHATKPSRGAKERRLQAKKQAGQRKAQRRRPGFDD